MDQNQRLKVVLSNILSTPCCWTEPMLLLQKHLNLYGIDSKWRQQDSTKVLVDSYIMVLSICLVFRDSILHIIVNNDWLPSLSLS